MAGQISGNPSVVMQQAAEARMEEERMRDVLLLLDHLVKHQETTAILILDCLYDIGSVNLINRKLRSRQANQVVKWIAKLSKPVFRIVALRWFKKNCPQLIADWLHSQVKFAPTPNTPEAVATEVLKSQSTALAKLETTHQEVLRLRSQVKVLTSLLIGVTVTLGGAFAWTVWKDQANPFQPVKQLRTATTIICHQDPAKSTATCR